MTPNDNSPVVPDLPEFYDEILGVYTDMKLLMYCLHFESEMDEQDRGTICFAGDRIMDRFYTVVDKASTLATLTPLHRL